ncbi:MAG: DUF3455 domain-containing protein [Anaerolineae bacterium]
MRTTLGMVSGKALTIARIVNRFRLRLAAVALAVAALCLLALVAPVGAAPTNDDVPPALGTCQNVQVPAGNRGVFHAYAEGVQVYRWLDGRWNFVAPEAVLSADATANSAVGIHYAGPTWMSVSGSKVVGTALESCTADTDAIPWLLLGAVSSEGRGMFDGVTFVQRVNTVGGQAPNRPGYYPTEEVRVPYKAEYFFYKRQP